MLFQDTTGAPTLEAMHRQVAEQSRRLVFPLLAREPGVENFAAGGEEDLQMVWEVWRAVLQGLALWWYEHQSIPRSRLVATAMNALWIGFERVRQGETHRP